jgi:Ser/Thr protein kinase RdoA (MazF antagonist)
MRLLKHLEEGGFTAAPRPRESGFAPDGREALSFIPGEPAPACWSAGAAYRVGVILKELHSATAGFVISDPTWMPWWGRDLPTQDLVLGHCDAAPWNFLSVDGLPVALLDWDTAGPVGREWDLAQTAWLNAQLHDDDVAERLGLPDAISRAGLLAAICDGYELARDARMGLVGCMIEVATRTAAQEAIDAGVDPDRTSPTPMGLLGGGPPMSGHELLWAVTWRVRGARWMLDHERLLAKAVQ